MFTFCGFKIEIDFASACCVLLIVVRDCIWKGNEREEGNRQSGAVGSIDNGN